MNLMPSVVSTSTSMSSVLRWELRRFTAKPPMNAWLMPRAERAWESAWPASRKGSWGVMVVEALKLELEALNSEFEVLGSELEA